MSIASSIARNSIYLYVRMLFVLGVNLYTVRVVLNSLGAEDFGIYGLAGGIVAMFAFLNNTMSSAAQRFLAMDIGKQDDVSLGKTFNATLASHFIISLAVILLGETVGFVLLDRVLQIPADRMVAAHWTFQLSLAATAALILRTPYNALVIARQNMGFFALTTIIETCAKLAAALAISRSSSDRLVTYAVLICLISWCMLGWQAWFCRRRYAEARVSPHKEWKIYKDLASFISWSFIGSFSNVLRTHGVNALLNVFFGTRVNAAYGVMNQAQTAASQFAGSFQLALSPSIYQAYARNEMHRMRGLVLTGAKLNFMMLMLLVVPAIHGMDYLLSAWLVAPPQHSLSFVRWILALQLLESASQPLSIAAAATGRIRAYQCVVGGTYLLCLPLSWLTFHLGGHVSSFLYVAALVQIAVLTLRVMFLKGMIELSPFAFLRHVVAPLAAVSTVAAISLLAASKYMPPPETFTHLLAECATIVTPVALGCAFIGLTRQERHFAFEMLARRLRRRIH